MEEEEKEIFLFPKIPTQTSLSIVFYFLKSGNQLQFYSLALACFPSVGQSLEFPEEGTSLVLGVLLDSCLRLIPREVTLPPWNLDFPSVE